MLVPLAKRSLVVKVCLLGAPGMACLAVEGAQRDGNSGITSPVCRRRSDLVAGGGGAEAGGIRGCLTSGDHGVGIWKGLLLWKMG